MNYSKCQFYSKLDLISNKARHQKFIFEQLYFDFSVITCCIDILRASFSVYFIMGENLHLNDSVYKWRHIVNLT